ncbi:MAG: class I SAM-dependent rRNA methyltransferase [Cyclobacteriaceae bacterium]
MKQITIKKGKEISLIRRHPWLFSGAIATNDSNAEAGEWVEVCDHHGKVLGCGHFDSGSIAVRMLSFEKADPENPAFWHTKLMYAYRLRKNLQLPDAETSAFRLVHGEGDGLPGLIVDVYNQVAVMQAHSSGMHHDRIKIAAALMALPDQFITAVYYKSTGTLPGPLRDAVPDGFLQGDAPSPALIKEYGIEFIVDWVKGQKTGFFADQRENRKILSQYARNKKVLNTFCYSGSFSMCALTGGAELVHSVDASSHAIQLTEQLISQETFQTKHQAFVSDAFTFIEKSETSYDLIILDPPAFAKHKSARHNAIKGYQRLNKLALQKIAKGGILFTFSCSQVIDRQLFYDTVASAAIIANRRVRVLHHLSQGPDHPVSMYHPEGEYLKGLVLEVE